MAFDLFKEVNTQLSNTSINQSADMPDIPQEVRAFLGNLGLLKGIPVHYLIPNEYYLPKTLIVSNGEPIEQGSLKLFWLDKEWIECLIDGALSIGGPEYRDLLLTKAMAGNYAAEVFYEETKEQIKKQLTGVYNSQDFANELNSRLKRKNITILEGKPMPTVAQSNWCYTGFFMRSVLIASWVGVEVVAKGKDPNVTGTNNAVRPLQVVRLERVADDTIFCVCEGIISEIDVIQPPETVHFGITPPAAIAGRAKGVMDIKNMGGKTTAANFAKTSIAKPLTVHLNINWNQST